MQNQTKKKSKFRSFYTAIGISLMMIGAACWYAYDQTSNTLEQNLDSITEQISIETTIATVETEETDDIAAVEVQTDIPLETEAATTNTANTTTEATTETETTTTTEVTVIRQIVAPLTDYRVCNPFSNGELVKSETTGTWQTHNGVDLACSMQEDVYAIDVGTVIEVTNDPLWGYTVTIDHENGIKSRYCGLDGSLDVREGDIVQSGQKIGQVGNTADIESGLETHLHFEVLKSGVYVDPMEYIGS